MKLIAEEFSHNWIIHMESFKLHYPNRLSDGTFAPADGRPLEGCRISLHVPKAQPLGRSLTCDVRAGKEVPDTRYRRVLDRHMEEISSPSPHLRYN